MISQDRTADSYVTSFDQDKTDEHEDTQDEYDDDVDDNVDDQDELEDEEEEFSDEDAGPAQQVFEWGGGAKDERVSQIGVGGGNARQF